MQSLTLIVPLLSEEKESYYRDFLFSLNLKTQKHIALVLSLTSTMIDLLEYLKIPFSVSWEFFKFLYTLIK